MNEQRSGRNPTIIDVAHLAGVSKSVVSRVFTEHGSVSAPTRARVLQAAADLGYVVNAMARSMAAQRTHTLGVFVRDAATSFYGHLLTAMQERAAHHGYRIVTATGSGRFAVPDERRALETLVQLQVEALVVCSGLLPVEEVLPFCQRIPVAIAGRPEIHAEISSVFCDEEGGGAAMADHLLDLGHRHVAVLRLGADQSLTMAPRTSAMVRRLQERGAEVLEVPGRTVADVEDPVRRVLSDPTVTAIMAPSDAFAISVLESLQRQDVSVPEQLSVTGYDGVGMFSTPLIGLSTWVQPISLIGSLAIDAVVAQLEGGGPAERHQSLDGALRVGRTTGPPASRR